MKPGNIFWVAGAAAVLLMEGGCAAGPDYQHPGSVSPRAYTAGLLSGQTASTAVSGGESQRFVFGEKLVSPWWELFHSQELNAVVHMALDNNLTLAAGQARLREAAEVLKARTGSEYFPEVSAAYAGSRQGISPAAQGLATGKTHLFNLHQASLGFSYIFDIFGGGRREIEALRAKVDDARFQMEGMGLSLIANVTMTAIAEGLLREELSSMRDILASQEKQLMLLEKQFALGSVSRVDVFAQKAQVESLRAEIPGIEKTLAQERHALAVLAGKPPEGAGEFSEFQLSQWQLPQELPVSLPSELVRQRPDIRAAEALLRAANAQVGVAAADLYPQIVLNGNWGSEALTVGTLFNAGTMVASVGAGITQPLFNGGSRQAAKRAAMAAYDEALANYQQTVLVAFREVADALRFIESDAVALKAQSDAFSAAQASLDLAQGQFQAGAVGYMTLLNAERQQQTARISFLKAKAARFTDTVILFQALGGTWDKNRT